MLNWVSVAAVFVMGPPALTATDAEQLARAAYQGCLQNLRSFDNIDCRFEESSWLPASLEAALAGDVSKSVSTAGRWLRKGGVERFYRAADPVTEAKLKRGPAPHPTRKGIGVVEMTFVPTDSLDNGKLELSYRPDVGQAALLPFDYAEERKMKDTPFMRAVERGPAFGWCMENLSNGVLKITESRQVVEAGRSLVVVKFRDTDGKMVVATIDPASGFLPTRTEILDETGRTEMVLVVQDVSRRSNGGYFPMAITSVNLPKDPSRPISARRIRVTDLVTDRAPAASDVAVVLPEGTLISQRPMGGGYPFRLRKDETIGPDDIQKLWAMTEEAAKNRLMDTAVPRAVAWPYFFAAGIVLLLGSAYVAFRKLRPA